MNFRSFLLFLVGCLTFAFDWLPLIEIDDKQEKTQIDQKSENLTNDVCYEKITLQENSSQLFDVDEKDNLIPNTLELESQNEIDDTSLSLIAKCKDATIALNGDGVWTIDSTYINDGSSCSCTALNFSLSQSDFDCSEIGENDVVLYVEDVSTSTIDSCTATVTVEDNGDPYFECTSTTYVLNEFGYVEVKIEDFISYVDENCSVDYTLITEDTLFCSNLGQNQVELHAIDPSGNTWDCQTFVLVEDDSLPNALCKSEVDISLGADGTYILDHTEVDDGSNDNCSIVTYSLSQYNFDCDDLPSKSLTMFVTDNASPPNSASCDFTVNITNGSVPDMICQDLEISLDSNGDLTISPEDVNDGSTIACGTIAFSLDQDQFNCTNLGLNTINLSGVGDGGGSSSCEAVISIIDTDEPALTCVANYEVSLDIDGNAILDPSSLITVVEDNCTETSDLLLVLSQTTFSCDDLGSIVPITLTVTDASNNAATCSSEINIVDDLGPEINCLDSEVTVTNINGELIASDQFIESVLDNCDLNPSISPATFSFACAEQGLNNLEISAIDANGNVSICSFTVDVLYDDTPIALCVDEFTAELDSDGLSSISVLDIDAGSFVLCENPALSLDITLLTCDNLGPNTVTLTVRNENDIFTTCQTTVNVVDEVDPVLTCNTDVIPVYLNANGQAIGSYNDLVLSASDNCGVANFVVEEYSFTCPDMGFNLVPVTVVDGSNNEMSCNAFVEVFDTIKPNAVCIDAEVQLGSLGVGSVTTAEITQGSLDNCSIQTSTGELSFSCADLGDPFPVVFDVFDQSNNKDTCISMITVVDLIKPDAFCQSTEIFVNADNVAILVADSINNNSFDNCSELELSLSKSEFNCSDLGQAFVVLTVTDQSGNSDDCEISITVSDNNNPQAECAPITEVALDDSGNLELEFSDVFSGASFSCSADTGHVDPFWFDCDDVGQIVTVKLTVTGNNSTSEKDCFVKILDLTPPSFDCVDLDTVLVSSTDILISPEDLVENVYDECTQDEIYYNYESLEFDCSHVGINEIDLIVVDGNLNPDTCTVNINIVDQTPPLAVCVDQVKVYLDENGEGSITIDDVDAGSTNLCGDELQGVAVVLDNSSFYCSNITMINKVELQIKDAFDNVYTCNSLVTVVDTISPEITSITEVVTLILPLDQDEIQLSSAAFDAAGVDNCMLSVSQIRRVDEVCGSTNEFGAGVKFCKDECSKRYELDLRLQDESLNYDYITVYVDLINEHEPCNTNTVDGVAVLSELICRPNPFVEITYLDFNLNEPSDAQLKVYSSSGALVMNENHSFGAGQHSVPLDISDQPSGAYFCEMITPKGSRTIRLIKMN